MLEKHKCLLHNACSEAGDLFHTVSLCGLSRFRHCFLVGSLICFLAKSMQTPCASCTSTCSSSLTSPDSDEYDEHNICSSMLNLLCHEYGTVMESYLDEVVWVEFHFRQAPLPLWSTR